MSARVYDDFVLFQGPPPRVIIFLSGTKGLVPFAEWMRVRTCFGQNFSRNNYDIAVDVALVTFGQHPEQHRDKHDIMRMILGSTGEKIADRVRNCGAPQPINATRDLLQWYMETAFPIHDSTGRAATH